MSLQQVRAKVEFELKRREGLVPIGEDHNPLKTQKSIHWLKAKATCHENYKFTVDEKLTVLELKRLFERFDVDKSGAIDLDELGFMFEAAGLIIDCSILKKIFRQGTGQNVKFQTLEVESFAKLLASRNVETRFKKLITQIRQKYANHDYSVCNTTDDLYLPIDLSAMIKYLDKRYQKNVLRSQIKSDLIVDAKGWSDIELRK